MEGAEPAATTVVASCLSLLQDSETLRSGEQTAEALARLAAAVDASSVASAPPSPADAAGGGEPRAATLSLPQFSGLVVEMEAPLLAMLLHVVEQHTGSSEAAVGGALHALYKLGLAEEVFLSAMGLAELPSNLALLAELFEAVLAAVEAHAGNRGLVGDGVLFLGNALLNANLGARLAPALAQARCAEKLVALAERHAACPSTQDKVFYTCANLVVCAGAHADGREAARRVATARGAFRVLSAMWDHPGELALLESAACLVVNLTASGSREVRGRLLKAGAVRALVRVLAVVEARLAGREPEPAPPRGSLSGLVAAPAAPAAAPEALTRARPPAGVLEPIGRRPSALSERSFTVADAVAGGGASMPGTLRVLMGGAAVGGPAGATAPAPPAAARGVPRSEERELLLRVAHCSVQALGNFAIASTPPGAARGGEWDDAASDGDSDSDSDSDDAGGEEGKRARRRDRAPSGLDEADASIAAGDLVLHGAVPAVLSLACAAQSKALAERGLAVVASMAAALEGVLMPELSAGQRPQSRSRQALASSAGAAPALRASVSMAAATDGSGWDALAAADRARVVSGQLDGCIAAAVRAASPYPSSQSVQVALLGVMCNLALPYQRLGPLAGGVSSPSLESLDRQWAEFGLPAVLRALEAHTDEIAVADLAVNVLAKLSSSRAHAERLVRMNAQSALVELVDIYNAGHRYRSPGPASPRSPDDACPVVAVPPSPRSQARASQFVLPAHAAPGLTMLPAASLLPAPPPSHNRSMSYDVRSPAAAAAAAPLSPLLLPGARGQAAAPRHARTMSARAVPSLTRGSRSPSPSPTPSPSHAAGVASSGSPRSPGWRPPEPPARDRPARRKSSLSHLKLALPLPRPPPPGTGAAAPVPARPPAIGHRAPGVAGTAAAGRASRGFAYDPNTVIRQVLVILSRLADVAGEELATAGGDPAVGLLLARGPAAAASFRVIEVHSMDEQTLVPTTALLAKLAGLPLLAVARGHEAGDGAADGADAFGAVVEDLAELVCGMEPTSGMRPDERRAAVAARGRPDGAKSSLETALTMCHVLLRSTEDLHTFSSSPQSTARWSQSHRAGSLSSASSVSALSSASSAGSAGGAPPAGGLRAVREGARGEEGVGGGSERADEDEETAEEAHVCMATDLLENTVRLVLALLRGMAAVLASETTERDGDPAGTPAAADAGPRSAAGLARALAESLRPPSPLLTDPALVGSAVIRLADTMSAALVLLAALEDRGAAATRTDDIRTSVVEVVAAVESVRAVLSVADSGRVPAALTTHVRRAVGYFSRRVKVRARDSTGAHEWKTYLEQKYKMHDMAARFSASRAAAGAGGVTGGGAAPASVNLPCPAATGPAAGGDDDAAAAAAAPAVSAASRRRDMEAMRRTMSVSSVSVALRLRQSPRLPGSFRGLLTEHLLGRAAAVPAHSLVLPASPRSPAVEPVRASVPRSPSREVLPRPSSPVVVSSQRDAPSALSRKRLRRGDSGRSVGSAGSGGADRTTAPAPAPASTNTAAADTDWTARLGRMIMRRTGSEPAGMASPLRAPSAARRAGAGGPARSAAGARSLDAVLDEVEGEDDPAAAVRALLRGPHGAGVSAALWGAAWPPAARRRAWLSLSRADRLREESGERGYSQLVALCDELQREEDEEGAAPPTWRDEVRKDVHRTLPGYDVDRAALERVLCAYVVRNPDEIGYCQSMGSLCVTALVVLGSEEDAFWMLCGLVEAPSRSGYYCHSMASLKVDQRVVESLVAFLLPRVDDHLRALECPVSAFSVSYLMCLMVEAPLALEDAVLFWDRLLVHGDEMLPAAVVAVLGDARERVLALRNTEEAYDFFLHGGVRQHLAVPSLLHRLTAAAIGGGGGGGGGEEEVESAVRISELRPMVRQLRRLHSADVLAESVRLDATVAAGLAERFGLPGADEAQRCWTSFLSCSPWDTLVLGTLTDVVHFQRAFGAAVFDERHLGLMRDRGLFGGAMSRLFRVLDVSGAGGVSWHEFLFGVHVLRYAGVRQRLGLCFRFFDFDGDGAVGRADADAALAALHETYEGRGGRERARTFCRDMFRRASWRRSPGAWAPGQPFDEGMPLDFELFAHVARAHPLVSLFFRLVDE